ncbi:MAG: hypothetical protein V2A69_02825 [Pseudomonadota bacterium]
MGHNKTGWCATQIPRCEQNKDLRLGAKGEPERGNKENIRMVYDNKINQRNRRNQINTLLLTLCSQPHALSSVLFVNQTDHQMTNEDVTPSTPPFLGLTSNHLLVSLIAKENLTSEDVTPITEQKMDFL